MWIAPAFFRSSFPGLPQFLDPERKVTPVRLLRFDVINSVFACTMDVYCVRACVRAYSCVSEYFKWNKNESTFVLDA